MKNITIIIATLLLLTTIGFGQENGSVSGLVMIEDKPIANAEVIITNAKGERRETISDANGKYVFENVPAGEYTLAASQFSTKPNSPNKISVTGNLQVSQKISVLPQQSLTVDLNILRFGRTRIGPTTVLTFDLSTESSNLSVGSGTNQPSAEVSKSIKPIYPLDIKERNETSLVDTMRTETGVFVQQNGGFGRPAAIKIRGLRSADTSVLIDGMRFRDAAAIDGDSSAFVSDFVFTSNPRIEVLRGAGSSVWGTNAIGGAISLQTQGRSYGFHGGLTTEIGSLGRKRIRANINDGWNKFGYSVAVSRTNITEGIDGDDDASNTGFNGRIDFRPKQNTNLVARFFVSDAFVKLNSNPIVINPPPFGSGIPPINAIRGVNFLVDGNDADFVQKSSIYNGQIRLTQKLAEKVWFTSAYQQLRTRRTKSDGPLINGLSTLPAFENTSSGEIRTFENKLNWTTNRNSLTVGYEFEAEKYRIGNASIRPSDNFFISAREIIQSFHATNTMNFLNRNLQISGGIRWQFFSLRQPTFSGFSNFQNISAAKPPRSLTYDGSVSYFIPKTKTKLRVHVGTGFRNPSLYERFGSNYVSFGNGAFFPVGNPELKPETSIGFDGGISQAFVGERLILSGTYFYSKIDDIAYFFQTDDIGRNRFINLSQQFSRGFEFEAKVRPTRSTNIAASYTFVNSDQRNYTNNFFPPIITRSFDGKSFGIPDHQFSVVATQNIGERFFVNFDFVATSNYLAVLRHPNVFGSFPYRFKGNRKADLSASYEKPTFKDKFRWRLFGTIENLLDYEYFENGFQTAGRTGKIGLSLTF